MKEFTDNRPTFHLTRCPRLKVYNYSFKSEFYNFRNDSQDV